MASSLSPLKGKEWLYTYRNSQQISMQTGLIGYIRADMGTNGNEFWSTWNSFRDDLNTPEFNSEKVDIINPFLGDGGFLSSRNELAKFCHSDKVFAYETGRDYGVRVNTQDYAYLMRLNPYKGEYNLYCYCYKKDWLDSHLEKAERGIRFINPDYKEIFRIEDGDKIRITYSDGEKADKICRYVDDYHFEADSDIFHICEFAERLEKTEAYVIPLRPSLPDQCYVFVQSENKIGIVNKGEKGYIDSKSANGKPSENRALVDDLNGKLGITKAQAEAMKAGSLLGWDCPAAEPKNYNEKGTPIKPKNRNHER